MAVTLLSINVDAKMNMGTINLQVGQEIRIESEPSTYYTVTGSWTKTGSAFYISARSNRSCTIRATSVGTATLEWMGVINATSAEMVWTVNVTAATVKVQKIKLSKSQLELFTNSQEQLTASVSPSNASNKSVSWSSDNTNIATVSSTGLVKGIGEGSATITCRATDGSGVSATCKVEVKCKVGDIISSTTSDGYKITYIITDANAKTCEVYGCDKNAKNIVISSYVQGFKVTSVGFNAFYNCEIESVTLPCSITSIKNQAFYKCELLKSIILPSAVTTIGSYAFADCKSLTNISGFNNVEEVGYNIFSNTPWLASLPDGVNYIGKVLYTYKGIMPPNTIIKVAEGCTQIVNDAFRSKDGLVGITIPSSLVSLQGQPFFSCGSLRSINVSTGNPIFDSRDNCNAIIKTKENELVVGCVGTTIPNSVKTIGSHAYGTATLREIIIPDNIDSIADYAYSSVKNIEKITIGKGLRVLGQSCFAQSSEIKSITVSTDNPYLDSRNNCNAIIETKNNKLLFGCDITVIPNSVETIGELAYSGSNLMMIVVPNTVTGIEDRAFGVTDNLRSITIGQNVKYLGKYLFINNIINSPWVLTSIRSLIYFPSDIDERVFCKNSTETDLIYNQTTLYVPKGSKANYQSAAGWNRFKNIVEIDDDEIYNGMCFTEETVEGVELTYTVTDAEKKECELIDSPTDVKGKVTIPSSVRGFTICGIGNSVFSSRETLTEVVMPNTIKTIGSSAFYGCSQIDNIRLSSSLKSIGSGAFRGTGIESITIPKSVESIGSYILEECVNLQSITVEEGNPYYDSRNNCNGIYVKATNTLLAGCMNTVIPEETENIGSVAFYGHTGLKEIKLPDNLKAIGNSAFYRTGISSIQIPASVATIGNNAFRSCPSLTSIIVMHEEPLEINESVFFSSTDTIYTFDQATLYVPEGTKDKYREADVWKNFKNIVDFDPDGIDDIIADEDKQGQIYSISGMRLKSPQKGINIINGKKILVK